MDAQSPLPMQLQAPAPAGVTSTSRAATTASMQRSDNVYHSQQQMAATTSGTPYAMSQQQQPAVSHAAHWSYSAHPANMPSLQLRASHDQGAAFTTTSSRVQPLRTASVGVPTAYPSGSSSMQRQHGSNAMMQASRMPIKQPMRYPTLPMTSTSGSKQATSTTRAGAYHTDAMSQYRSTSADSFAAGSSRSMTPVTAGQHRTTFSSGAHDSRRAYTPGPYAPRQQQRTSVHSQFGRSPSAAGAFDARRASLGHSSESFSQSQEAYRSRSSRLSADPSPHAHSHSRTYKRTMGGDDDGPATKVARTAMLGSMRVGYARSPDQVEMDAHIVQTDASGDVSVTTRAAALRSDSVGADLHDLSEAMPDDECSDEEVVFVNYSDEPSADTRTPASQSATTLSRLDYVEIAPSQESSADDELPGQSPFAASMPLVRCEVRPSDSNDTEVVFAIIPSVDDTLSEREESAEQASSPKMEVDSSSSLRSTHAQPTMVTIEDGCLTQMETRPTSTSRADETSHAPAEQLLLRSPRSASCDAPASESSVTQVKQGQPNADQSQPVEQTTTSAPTSTIRQTTSNTPAVFSSDSLLAPVELPVLHEVDEVEQQQQMMEDISAEETKAYEARIADTSAEAQQQPMEEDYLTASEILFQPTPPAPRGFAPASTLLPPRSAGGVDHAATRPAAHVMNSHAAVEAFRQVYERMVGSSGVSADTAVPPLADSDGGGDLFRVQLREMQLTIHQRDAEIARLKTENAKLTQSLRTTRSDCRLQVEAGKRTEQQQAAIIQKQRKENEDLSSTLDADADALNDVFTIVQTRLQMR